MKMYTCFLYNYTFELAHEERNLIVFRFFFFGFFFFFFLFLFFSSNARAQSPILATGSFLCLKFSQGLRTRTAKSLMRILAWTFAGRVCDKYPFLMRSPPFWLQAAFCAWSFLKVSVREQQSRLCASSPEPLLVAYVISTLFSCAGSFILFEHLCVVIHLKCDNYRPKWARHRSLGLDWSWYVTLCHSGHLGYQIRVPLAIENLMFVEFQDCHAPWPPTWILELNDLAILNLHATPMPPIKFRLNLIYGLGGDVAWRISRWPPWRPSWILEQNDFSNSEFP